MKKPMFLILVFAGILIIACNNPKKGLKEIQPKKENPTIQDIDGNVYKTVTIGTQVWMAKNLKTTKFNDNTAIPLVTNSAIWAALTTPAYCWYNNDTALKEYSAGALYNWYAVNTNKLCPKGWHVPTHVEWFSLTTYLGGDSVAGGKLKDTGTIQWESPNEGATNETGFAAQPSGDRRDDGLFDDRGYGGFLWSSNDTSATKAYWFGMRYGFGDVAHSYGSKLYGLSVRCVKD